MEENNNRVFEAQAAEVKAETGEEKINDGKKNKSLGREILEWTEAIVLAVIVAMLVRGFIFTVVKVDGQSMDNTLANNDRLIVWRLGYEPKQGDIVVFAPDIAQNHNTHIFNRVYWIKRVIATEGQHVEINYDENAVYVDGVKLDEPYLPEPMRRPNSSSGNVIESIDIPEGHVFLMGDNRNHSNDCRNIGPVDVKDIVGKASLRFWPFSSFGTVTHNN